MCDGKGQGFPRSTHYLSKVGNWEELVQSDQKLPQQLLQLLVKLGTIIHRKLLLIEDRIRCVGCDTILQTSMQIQNA